MRNRIIIALWAGLLALALSGLVALGNASASASSSDDCAPAEAWDEITDWTTDPPPSDEWQIYDERVVEDAPATEGTWANRVWHVWTGGPRAENDPPAVDDPNWNATGANPGGVHEFSLHTPNVPYWVDKAHPSESLKGKDKKQGDWFLWTATWVDGLPAVTHTEWRYVFSHDAVECPEPTDEPTSTPTKTPVPDVPRDEEIDHPIRVTKKCIAGDLVIKKYVWSDAEQKYVFKSGSYGVGAKQCAEKLQGTPVKEEGF